MNLLKPAAIKFESNYVTDHNRSDVSVSVERIESARRMANGTMRKYVIADKRSFSLSWNMCPESMSYTVDNKWGAKDLETFYNNTPGEFDLIVTYGDSSTDTFLVMFKSFEISLLKRGRYDFYDVSLSLEEV